MSATCDNPFERTSMAHNCSPQPYLIGQDKMPSPAGTETGRGRSRSDHGKPRCRHGWVTKPNCPSVNTSLSSNKADCPGSRPGFQVSLCMLASCSWRGTRTLSPSSISLYTLYAHSNKSHFTSWLNGLEGAHRRPSRQLDQEHRSSPPLPGEA